MVNNMTETELRQYLIKQYPKEAEGCEWKEFFPSKAAEPREWVTRNEMGLNRK